MNTSNIKVPFGNLKLNYSSNKKIIDLAISRVLQNGWYILGDEVTRFEIEFAKYCRTSYAIGVGSGTEALHLALISSGIKTGDEVITVANTCVPTISAISFAGAKPIFVDINENTYTIDPQRIEERITKRTKAIIPVHLYGQCCNMDDIVKIVNARGITIIEDCAQAHGALYKNKIAGSFGDVGCYSFYPSKNLGSLGDSGCCVTNNDCLNQKLRELRNYGQRERYVHYVKGFNSRLDEIQAAILLEKLKLLDAWNKRRREIAAKYNFAFSNLNWLTCPYENDFCYHVYHLYVIRVPDRKKFQEYLFSHGISTLIHYPIPIHKQLSYAECFLQSKYLTVTEKISEEIISLPIYPELEENQINYIIDVIKSWNP
jgi:dTDP-4-amino-4,6-dideoxygalactose transaminase